LKKAKPLIKETYKVLGEEKLKELKYAQGKIRE
jgi:hypothetical protein